MSDDWATPDWLWGKFANYFDPCEKNPRGLRTVDGLGTAESWIRMIKANSFEGLKLNPPHSDPFPWVERGIIVAKAEIETVILLRLDSTTKHHKALVEAGFHPFGAFERIRYGNSDHGGQYANVLWFSP